MRNGESSYRRFVSGDKEGLVEIIRDYKDGLILYICSITGDCFNAEEIAEDTFIKLYTDKPAFKGNSTFKTWLYSIGRHTAVDYMRRHKHRNDIPLDSVCEAASAEDIEKSLIKEEERIMLHRAMQRLNPEYRQVLCLKYFGDIDHTETAAIMKKSVRQVTDLLYRAKNALKKELEKEGFRYEGL